MMKIIGCFAYLLDDLVDRETDLGAHIFPRPRSAKAVNTDVQAVPAGEPLPAQSRPRFEGNPETALLA